MKALSDHPYGQTRGDDAAIANALWPDDHTFLGKTTDTSTGLVDVGARKYDPATGRFISIDPVFSAGNPQTLGGYTYAANDPVNGSDPSGLVVQASGDGYVPILTDSNNQAYVVVDKYGVGDWRNGDLRPWIIAPADAQWTDAFMSQYYNDLNQWEPGWYNFDPSAAHSDAGTLGRVAQQACGEIAACKASGWYSLYEAQRWSASISEAEATSAAQAGRVEGGPGGISSEEAANIAAQDLALNAERGPLRSFLSKLTSGPLKPLRGEFGESLGSSCATHSFAADTKVLMADGTTEPIQDVKVGGEIENAQPGGRVEHHRVDQVHKTLTDKDFTDLTVSTPTGPVTITGTQNHPYYDLTAGRFVNASGLKPGDRLQTTVGDATVRVLAVRDYTSSIVTYDLTIDGLHTYYVVAGETPVLVHNSDCVTYLYRVAQKGNGSSELSNGLDPKNFPLNDESDGSAYFGNEARTTDFSKYHQDSHELKGYRVAVPTQWLEQHGIEAYEGMTADQLEYVIPSDLFDEFNSFPRDPWTLGGGS